MIRATELAGRAVVDIDAAEKLGRIDKVILDPDARRVAGFRIARGGSLLGGGTTHTTVPADTVHAVGPDAVTIRHPSSDAHEPALDALPRASDLIGRKVVSTEGRLLGVVHDVLISGADGIILGYELSSAAPLGKVSELLGEKRRQAPYIRADADLRPGRDLIIAPEEAVTEWIEEEPERETRRTQAPTAEHYSARPADEPAVWTRPATGAGAAPNVAPRERARENWLRPAPGEEWEDPQP